MRSRLSAALLCLALAAAAASPDFRAPPLGSAGLATNIVMTWAGYTLGCGRNGYNDHIFIDLPENRNDLTVCSWVAVRDADGADRRPDGEPGGLLHPGNILPALYYSPNIEKSAPDLLGGAWGWGSSPVAVSGSLSFDYGFPAASDAAPVSYRFLRMTITEKRSSTENLLQLSEIKLVTTSGTAFSWPAGTTVSATVSTGKASTSTSETPAKLIDNSVSTKMCAQNGKNLPCTITIDLGSGSTVDLSVYSRWQWYTANDAANRDPTAFSISASNDGSSWATLDSAKASITTSRRALAYTGILAIPPPPDYERVAWNGGATGTNVFPRGVYTVAWTNLSSTMTLTAGGTDMTLGAPAGTRNVEPGEAAGFILTGSGTAQVGISRTKVEPFYKTDGGAVGGAGDSETAFYNGALVSSNFCFVAHRVHLDASTHTNNLTMVQRDGSSRSWGGSPELPPDGSASLRTNGLYQLVYTAFGSVRATYVYEWDRRVFHKWLSDDDLSAIFEDGCRIRDAFGYPDCVVSNAIYQEDP